MLHQGHRVMLLNLEKLLKEGTLTPAKRVTHGTIVCITEKFPHGMAYHQIGFEELPNNIRSLFENKVKGDTVGNMKVVAIFDAWMPPFEEAPRVDDFDI